MTEIEFRKDEAAVKALEAFLSSGDGKKFLAVLDEESIINKLASAENQTERGVRALPVVETGSADNILGRCVGYQLVSKLIKRLRVRYEDTPPLRESRASRVARTMIPSEDIPSEDSK